MHGHPGGQFLQIERFGEKSLVPVPAEAGSVNAGAIGEFHAWFLDARGAKTDEFHGKKESGG
ncbi:MAG: hypothetical protein R3F31_06495 [Verrucomicrobiales bacterium]